MRYVKFWLVGNEAGDNLTSVRGQSLESEDRYEIDRDGDNWRCLRVVPSESDESWGFELVKGDASLFDCMIAAENDAKEIANV
jgi:hypothetical protein